MTLPIRSDAMLVSMRVLLMLSLCAGQFFGACTSIPKEAAELSYTVGQDIQELHKGYRETVRTYFEQLRARGLDVIDNRWKPVYLKSNVEESGLFAHLQDLTISESERYDDLEYWMLGALEDISAKRTEFLDSLQRREDTLMARIDDAFSRVIRANGVVTGHLHSLVKVKTVQDDLLRSAGLGALRDSIVSGIANASEFATQATAELEAATRTLEHRR